MPMPLGNGLEQRQRQNDAVRHIQPHHRELPAGGKHMVGGVRVVPDIGLGHRRDIARLGHGAAHHHHFTQQAWQFRGQLAGQAEVAQRTDRYQRDVTRQRARHVHDELGRCPGVDLVPIWGSAFEVAKAVRAVDIGRRRFAVLDPGLGNALGHRHGFAGNGCEVQRINSGLLYRYIAKGGGDANDVDARMGQCVVQGHGVIHPGIGVKDDFDGSFLVHSCVAQFWFSRPDRSCSAAHWADVAAG